jgi:glycerophosphoryl diester phosphodiesterase
MQEWLQTPGKDSLRRCKLISHRGEHDNSSVFENTLPAFAMARDSGVWGIECDFRWTADLVPIVCHDPDGKRLFGKPEAFRDLTWPEVRERMPLIPTLHEVVTGFGGTTHLMLEIKEEHYPQPEHQKEILKDLLSGLSPGRDYHFLSLEPALFERVDFVPMKCCLPVAQTSVSRFSQACLESGYGGLTGHYLLLSNQIKQRHETAGQSIGTGFVNSRNCLFRELNRGIEWIFSNEAVEMQGILEQLRGTD